MRDQSFEKRLSPYRLAVEKDLLEFLRFSALANPRKLNAAFAKYGITISNDNDLTWLAQISESGEDIDGAHGVNGQLQSMNVSEIVHSIQFTPHDIHTAMGHLDLVEFENLVKQNNEEEYEEYID